MKLEPPSRRKKQVHELAKEIGWTSKQLIYELRRRGEYVTSARATLEEPVVRAMLREFAPAISELDAETELTPELYGTSADLVKPFCNDSDESLFEAYKRIKAQPSSCTEAPQKTQVPRSAILQALTEEVMARRRTPPGKTAQPSLWERDKANELNGQWAAARLAGLVGDDATIITWIRLSQVATPQLAVHLSSIGISVHEASLRIGYGGRIDPRFPTIYERVRDRTMNRSEAINVVRTWRERQAVS